MSYLLAAALLLPAALLQVTLAPSLAVSGAFPNLLVVVVAGWTLCRGAGAGMRWALGGGLLLDLLAPGPLGVHAVALVAAAYAAGYVQRSYDPDPAVLPALTGLVAALVYNVVIVATAEAAGTRLALAAVFFPWVIPASLYCAALLPPAALALRWVERRLPRPRPEVTAW